MTLYTFFGDHNNPLNLSMQVVETINDEYVRKALCISDTENFFAEVEATELKLLHSMKDNFPINSKQFNTIILMIELYENEKIKLVKENELCVAEYLLNCMQYHLKNSEIAKKIELLNHIKLLNSYKEKLIAEKNSYSRKATREKAKLKRYIPGCPAQEKTLLTDLRKQYLKKHLDFQQQQLKNLSAQIDSLRHGNLAFNEILLEYFRQCFLTYKRINSNDRQENQYWSTVGAISGNFPAHLSFKLA